LEVRVKEIKGELADLRNRLESVERQLGHLDSIYNRIGRLEDESLLINDRLKPVEESVESGDLKRSDLEVRVKEIKGELADLRNRLESVERQLGT
jgi:chromosome segregation ATPase